MRTSARSASGCEVARALVRAASRLFSTHGLRVTMVACRPHCVACGATSISCPRPSKTGRPAHSRFLQLFRCCTDHPPAAGGMPPLFRRPPNPTRSAPDAGEDNRRSAGGRNRRSADRCPVAQRIPRRRKFRAPETKKAIGHLPNRRCASPPMQVPATPTTPENCGGTMKEWMGRGAFRSGPGI